MAKLGLSSPWMIFYHKVEALFAKDNEVKVIYDEANRAINLYVDNAAKADVLAKHIPEVKKFGRVDLKINVIPANGANATGDFASLFENNGAVSFVKTIDSIGWKCQYVVFKKEVVQFFTDDLGDYNGYHSTLYEDIAREVFENTEGVFFCTDTQNSVTFMSPLGEWP